MNSKTPRRSSQYRNVVVTLVERGGSARSFHVDGTTVKPKLTDKEQSERFIETARKLHVDESGKSFNLAINKLLRKGST